MLIYFAEKNKGRSEHPGLRFKLTAELRRLLVGEINIEFPFVFRFAL